MNDLQRTNYSVVEPHRHQGGSVELSAPHLGRSNPRVKFNRLAHEEPGECEFVVPIVKEQRPAAA